MSTKEFIASVNFRWLIKNTLRRAAATLIKRHIMYIVHTIYMVDTRILYTLIYNIDVQQRYISPEKKKKKIIYSFGSFFCLRFFFFSRISRNTIILYTVQNNNTSYDLPVAERYT